MADVAESGGRFEDHLAWRAADNVAVGTQFALRRHWSGPLYRRVRAEWDARAPKVDTGDLATAASIAEDIPAAREFRFLDRWLQEEMWRIAGASVDSRRDKLEALMAPKNSDLGTLSADLKIEYPAYYSEMDFHLQHGGIWRDDRGALIYFMGARLVHVGKNDSFELHDAFAKSLGDISPKTILDLGCGYGKTTFSLKKRWPDAQVIGVDPSFPCLKLARRLGTERGHAIDWQQGVGERLPVDDASQDLVTITMVLHEVPPDDIRTIFNEVRRVLKPGGTLAMLENRTLGDPCRDVLAAWHSMLIGEPWSVPYRALDIDAELRDAGYSSTDVQPWYAPGTNVETERNTQRWFSPWALSRATR